MKEPKRLPTKAWYMMGNILSVYPEELEEQDYLEFATDKRYWYADTNGKSVETLDPKWRYIDTHAIKQAIQAGVTDIKIKEDRNGNKQYKIPSNYFKLYPETDEQECINCEKELLNSNEDERQFIKSMLINASPSIIEAIHVNFEFKVQIVEDLKDLYNLI